MSVRSCSSSRSASARAREVSARASSARASAVTARWSACAVAGRIGSSPAAWAAGLICRALGLVHDGFLPPCLAGFGLAPWRAEAAGRGNETCFQAMVLNLDLGPGMQAEAVPGAAAEAAPDE